MTRPGRTGPDRDRTAPSPPATVIAPPARGFRMGWGEVWRFRELLLALAARDLRVRYKQTLLGGAWAVFQPLSAAAIFTVFFGRFMGVNRYLPEEPFPYGLFVYSGMWCWLLFSGVALGAAGSLLANSHVLTRVYFPRLVLPLSVIGYVGLDWLLGGAALGGLFLWWGKWPQATAPLALLFVPGILMAALGVGAGLAALTVRYRDLRHATPTLFQLWLYATPVAYPLAVVQEEWRPWVALNPMVGLLEGVRSCLFGWPLEGWMIALAYGSSAALLLLGVGYFHRAESQYADYI